MAAKGTPKTRKSPAHSTERRARRSSHTRERLFRTALVLFAERGFLATTVEDITAAADVGKGTFFNYFPTKEHIFGAFGEIQVGNVEAALEDARSGSEDILHVLERLARALAREPGRSPALVRSIVVANLSSEPVRQIFLRNLTRGRQLLAEIIALGQRRGEIRNDRDPLELARLFQQTFLGLLLLWALHPPSSLAIWLERTFSLFLAGLAARPASVPVPSGTQP